MLDAKMSETIEKSLGLLELINSRETLVMPDAYDPISARVIEKSGFKAVQCSGYSISIAACLRAETDLSRDENVEATRRIVNAVNVPVMADGEDGYGGPDEVADTVRMFIKAGAAGMNIEDLILSGSDCSLADIDLMLRKITAAREAAIAAGNPHFVINSRTDALRVLGANDTGLQEAIKRSNLYLEAGSNLAFATSVSTLEEVRVLVRDIKGPVSIGAGMPYNINSFSIDDLKKQGVGRVSIPAVAIFSVVKALQASISLISEPDCFSKIVSEGHYCSSKELASLL